MLYRALAAILLIPASFFVFTTPRAWIQALRQGTAPFFQAVKNAAPALTNEPSSRLKQVFAGIPARISLLLLQEKSFYRTWKYLPHALKRTAFDESVPDHNAPPLPQLSLQRVQALIRNPAIRVVSFDIFDTLLLRPVINREDLFHLLARKVNPVYSVDFAKMRLHTERRLNNPCAPLNAIYDCIQRKYKLSTDITKALMKEEIRCEAALLAPRTIMAELHAEARRLGKRVIAVSDSYHSESTLRDILHSKGLDVSAVYVSSEHNAQKHDGTLYPVVVNAEGVDASEILHIGASYTADCVRALENSIAAIHVPALTALAFGDCAFSKTAFTKAIQKDPLWSLLLGSSVNQLYDTAQPPKSVFQVDNLQQFTRLTIAPLLTAFSLSIADSADIQGAQHVFFGTRDGTLPRKMYASVRQHLACGSQENAFCTDCKAPEWLLESLHSGDVDKTVTCISGRPSSALYFCKTQSPHNTTSASGTATHVFINIQKKYSWVSMLLKELFSPCAENPSEDSYTPTRGESATAEKYAQHLQIVHATAMNYCDTFCATLGDYAKYAVLSRPDFAVDMLKAILCGSAQTLSLFRPLGIRHTGPHTETPSLEKRLEPFFAYKDVFCGTGFDAPDATLHPAGELTGEDKRIGIHLHLYHIHLSQEILRYLQDFPVPFDLYITLTNAAFTRTAQALFNDATIPQVQKVMILPMPNRGRDVAPWVLGMRPYQHQYDLFCHIHTKKSPHITFGDAWRHYLFDNLLRADAVADILCAFRKHPEIGCLFPAMYKTLQTNMVQTRSPLCNSEQEYGLIVHMLQHMGLTAELCRSEIIFPAGTMLWYRPPALHQLFNCALSQESFPQEPIGAGGTLAHAIERIPAVLARRNGYLAQTLTRYPSPDPFASGNTC